VPSAEAVKLFGMTAYLDLNWSKKWTSSIGYSFDKVDNTNFQEAAAFHEGQYASVNLLWHPADNVFTGDELLWGKRADNDGIPAPTCASSTASIGTSRARTSGPCSTETNRFGGFDD